MIEKQVVTTTIEIDGKPWTVFVTRQFVLNALARRKISNADFYDFTAKRLCTIELLARRKIKLLGLTTNKVKLDRDDLPMPPAR